MSFDSAIGLNQIDATMDQIEIQRRQILLSLDNIYTTLIYGTQMEADFAFYAYFLYNKLKHYWYDIPTADVVKTQEDQDEIEFFLSSIANFD